jgi:hypothetical protein
MVAKKPTGRGVDEFRKAYDKSLIIPAKFRDALAQLGDAWEEEGEFIKRVGCSQSEFGRFKEQFYADHTLEVRRSGIPRRVWAGTKKLAAKLRAIMAQQ